MLRGLGLTWLLFLSVTIGHAQDGMPAGTLRATYIASNPVQAFVAPDGELKGPGAELARELARKLGLTLDIKGAAGPQGVIDSLKSGAADIGFVAFDAVRAAEVDFSQTYTLAQNSYVVPENSPIRSVAEIDKPGTRIAVAERDAGDFFLTRTLKSAEIRRNPGGRIEVGLQWMAAGEVQAYAANRQRLSEVVKTTPGIRLLPDNFYGVEQAVAVAKGRRSLLAEVNKLIDEARASGFTAGAIARSGLVGVDVAPKGTRQ